MQPRQGYPDTRWSVVMVAAQDGVPAARGALEVLFSTYWYPLFAHLRARGHSRHEAEDLLQAFFVHLVEHRTLGRADPLKGSFRGFLVGCLRYFLANQRELAAAHKRGGNVRLVSLDFDAAEARVAGESSDPSDDVERDFDRRWARHLMERALAAVEAEWATRPETFAALKGFLTASDATRYVEVADRLGTTEGAVKVAVHRLRTQFRERLRAEIAATVAAPHEIDEELRHLARVLAPD